MVSKAVLEATYMSTTTARVLPCMVLQILVRELIDYSYSLLFMVILDPPQDNVVIAYVNKPKS